jgi:hypothetical protein
MSLYGDLVELAAEPFVTEIYDVMISFDEDY